MDDTPDIRKLVGLSDSLLSLFREYALWCQDWDPRVEGDYYDFRQRVDHLLTEYQMEGKK